MSAREAAAELRMARAALNLAADEWRAASARAGGDDVYLATSLGALRSHLANARQAVGRALAMCEVRERPSAAELDEVAEEAMESWRECH